MGSTDDDDSEEEDDDDSGPYHPSQMFQGFLNHMSDLARRSSRRPKENLCSRIRPDDDEEDSDEGDLNEECGTARCAACFRIDAPNHKWRRLGKTNALCTATTISYSSNISLVTFT